MQFTSLPPPLYSRTDPAELQILAWCGYQTIFLVILHSHVKLATIILIRKEKHLSIYLSEEGRCFRVRGHN